MVRINIIHPKKLTDQHLLAENLEILMLVSNAKKNFNPITIPKNYCLGKGHINFFKNKIIYLKKRHELIKKEMIKRGFRARKSISFAGFKKIQLKDWKPQKPDEEIIKERIIWKIKNKPCYYRYYGERQSLSFFKKLFIL